MEPKKNAAPGTPEHHAAALMQHLGIGSIDPAKWIAILKILGPAIEQIIAQCGNQPPAQP